jgi:hypothetical protein
MKGHAKQLVTLVVEEIVNESTRTRSKRWLETMKGVIQMQGKRRGGCMSDSNEIRRKEFPSFRKKLFKKKLFVRSTRLL